MCNLNHFRRSLVIHTHMQVNIYFQKKNHESDVDCAERQIQETQGFIANHLGKNIFIISINIPHELSVQSKQYEQRR